MSQDEQDLQRTKIELGIFENISVQQDYNRLQDLRLKVIEANKALSEAYRNKLPQDQIDALFQQVVDLNKEIQTLETKH
jgi:hypothetical protein